MRLCFFLYVELVLGGMFPPGAICGLDVERKYCLLLLIGLGEQGGVCKEEMRGFSLMWEGTLNRAWDLIGRRAGGRS